MMLLEKIVDAGVQRSAARVVAKRPRNDLSAT